MKKELTCRVKKQKDWNNQLIKTQEVWIYRHKKNEVFGEECGSDEETGSFYGALSDAEE